MQAARVRSLVKVLSSACRLTGGLWRALESSTGVPAHCQQQKSSSWLSSQEGEGVDSDDRTWRSFTRFLFGRFFVVVRLRHPRMQMFSSGA